MLLLAVPAAACTNILVAGGASAEGGTFVTYSCDGGVFAAVSIQEAVEHPQEAWVEVFGDRSYNGSSTVAPTWLGRIPQVRTSARYIDVRGGVDFYHLGGVNEHGVSIAETTLAGTRPELSNARGMLAPFSACAGRSLMTLALERATSAREAVRIIGSLAEEYGYSSPFPIDGEQLAIGDGVEVWSMEILGPGPDWAPGCGRPGAVWCAQRVPDGHVAVSANRSRIGAIDLSDADQFMASPNAVELAIEMGWWDPNAGAPFIWCEAYAPSERWNSVVREWRVLDLVAPSLHLRPEDGGFPFSVPAERRLSVEDVFAIQRDVLQGTKYDATADPAFDVDGARSPLASPQSSAAFYELLDMTTNRTISNRYASFSCVYQTRPDEPAAMRGCAWFGFGPAATSCYVPLYTGLAALPERWGRTNLAFGNLSLPFWTMTLPGQLAAARWQDAFPVIDQVRREAERAFLAQEKELAERPTQGRLQGPGWLDELTEARLDAVEAAFVALADYLRLVCLTDVSDLVSIGLPTVAIPNVADVTPSDHP